MQDTSCGDKCPFLKNGMCTDIRDCPNYIESWWTNGQETHPKLVHDCAPKRMLLQQQHMQLRVEMMEQSLEVARAEYLRVGEQLQSVIDSMNQILISNAKKLELDQKISQNQQDLGVLGEKNAHNRNLLDYSDD